MWLHSSAAFEKGGGDASWSSTEWAFFIIEARTVNPFAKHIKPNVSASAKFQHIDYNLYDNGNVFRKMVSLRSADD